MRDFSFELQAILHQWRPKGWIQPPVQRAWFTTLLASGIFGLAPAVSIAVAGEGLSHLVQWCMDQHVGEDHAMTPQALAGRLTNADLSWDGTIGGLLPRLSEVAIELRDRDDLSVVPQLLQLLRSRESFAAAHVLLVELVRPSPLRGEVSHQSYYGLRVKMSADGIVAYNTRDRSRLTKWWADVLESEANDELVQRALLVQRREDNRRLSEELRALREESERLRKQATPP
jgi:hypothetical protein